MEMKQEMEWKSAQSIDIKIDLVYAAKKHLKFLAAVDRNRSLYEGPALDRAIHRYNACWLPLLAKHSESPVFEGPLAAPLDCEWVWHCHRLNPIRYKKDCEEFYGRILDNKNVVSSFEGISRKPTEDMWKTLFPGEPYELDLEHFHEDDKSGERVVEENSTKYDLIAAVERQRPFFHQVSQLHMNDSRYIEGAVARYRGFLHLIKRNKERGINGCCVPTYDIDLIWHTHQLHPVSYCEDLVQLLGNILGHDDTDSDRTKGQKLDTGFTGTTKAFENIYGRRYMRAGALFKGSAPSPVRLAPYSGALTKKVSSAKESPKLALPSLEVFEVMLEFVGIRNLPEGHKGSLCVSLSKSQTDKFFKGKRNLPIFSASGEKQVASFQCQPTGNLNFELMSLTSDLPLTMGATSINLEDFLSSDSNLTIEKWLDLVPSSDVADSKPIRLRVAISVTVPTPAPYALHMVRAPKTWSRVVDDEGSTVFNLQMRDLKKSKGKKVCRRKVVLGLMNSGKPCPLAVFAEFKWSMVNSPWSLKLPNSNNDDGHLLEMTGPHTVRLYPGGRLDFESRQSEEHKAECEHERHLVTAVKFSAEEPYGTAVALLDLKSGNVKVKEEWFVLPGLAATMILANILRKTLVSKDTVGGCDSKLAKDRDLVSASGGSCWGSGGTCWGTGVSGGTCWGTGGSCWGNGLSGGNAVSGGGSCWGTGGSCWGNGVTGGSCWGTGGSCWGNGVTGGSCWGTGGSCWGNGVTGGSCWGSGGSCWGSSVTGGSCWGNGVTGGSCWGTGGSCWGNGVTGGSCWGSGVKSGSCWGNGVTGGSCWGSGVKSGSCWGNGVTGGSCWGSGVKSGSCWGNGVTGGSCWGSGVKSGSCWGNGVKGGSCWGTGIAGGMKDGGVKGQANKEVAVAVAVA